MHSFPALIGGILVTAVTILALPMGNVPRSLSYNSLDQVVSARNLDGTSNPAVPAKQPAVIKDKGSASVQPAQSQVHHKSKPRKEHKGSRPIHEKPASKDQGDSLYKRTRRSL
ncbi:hypothetical protein BYT27DRAFT_7183144 [Phlegmacium glaucopus]|nr:hypothetical protein BYT27DRAFT_7183144 [Phlegmacium glaucopus]